MPDLVSVRTIALRTALLFPIVLCWSGPATSAEPGSSPPGAPAVSVVTNQLYAGNLEAALKTGREAAEAHPSDLDAQELYIDLLLASGRPGLAATTYADRVRAHPTDPDAHYLLGRAVVKAEDAEEAYERALRLDPDHARSHMGMGAVHTARGDLVRSEAAYRASIQRDGTLGEAWLGLVRVLLLTGDPEHRALDIAQRGLAADPDEAGLALAVAAMDRKNARTVLEKAAKTTDDARIFVRLAELRLTGGDSKGALLAAEEALALDPGNGEAERMRVFADHIRVGLLDLEGLAALLNARDTMAEDPAAAVVALEALVRRYPSAPVVFLSLAEAYDRAGNRDKALEAFALTLQRDRTLVDAQAAFGLALMREERYSEAVPWLLSAVKARSWDPALVRALGHSQLRSGATADALTTLRAAHRTRPWEVPTLLSYAEALQANKQNEDAYALVRDALKKSADPRLAAAFVIAAQAAGHDDAAADFLEDLGTKAKSAKLLELARQIRAGG